MTNMPIGVRVPFKIESGDPAVVTVTYNKQRYKLRIQLSVLAVTVGHGEAQGGMPNFLVQSGNIMSIEKDTTV